MDFFVYYIRLMRDRLGLGLAPSCWTWTCRQSTWTWLCWTCYKSADIDDEYYFSVMSSSCRFCCTPETQHFYSCGLVHL